MINGSGLTKPEQAGPRNEWTFSPWAPSLVWGEEDVGKVRKHIPGEAGGEGTFESKRRRGVKEVVRFGAEERLAQGRTERQSALEASPGE